MRAQWNPLAPIAMLVIISVGTAITGFSTLDYIGFPVCALWLAAAIYDRRTGGRGPGHAVAAKALVRILGRAKLAASLAALRALSAALDELPA